jgi:mono/diheme cytochrome c family protein
MVYVVIVLWVAAALAVVLTGMHRGAARSDGAGRGTHDAARAEPKAGRRGLTALIVVVCAFGLVVPALVLAFNGAHKASVGLGDLHLNAEQQKGRELFSHACNLCHTLAGANAVGRTGPNLDVLIPTIAGAQQATEPRVAQARREAYVLSAILEGRARDKGQMPELLYQGKEAEEVAAFVAAVAGR